MGERQRGRTEDGLLLAVLELWVGAQDGAKVVVVDLFLVGHHEVAPLLLALLALHLVLVDCLGGVEVGEVALQVLEDVVVHLGEAQVGALDLFEDGPVRLHLDDGLDGELLLDLRTLGRWG